MKVVPKLVKKRLSDYVVCDRGHREERARPALRDVVDEKFDACGPAAVLAMVQPEATPDRNLPACGR